MSRIALAAILAVTAAPVLAGGLNAPVVVPAPVAPAPVAVVAPSADWSGFYLGGQIGTLDATLLADDADVADGNGAIYGVHAGYQADFGRFVLGGEVDYDAADITLEDAQGAEGPTLDSVFRGKVRVGYDAGRVLPYLTAGIAQASLTGVGDEDISADGSFYGIGAAYAVSDRFTVGGEYLTHDFDTIDIDGTEVDGLTAEADTFTLRASYNF